MGSAAVAGTALRWHLVRVVLAAGVAAAVAGGTGGSAVARVAGQAPGPAGVAAARPGGPGALAQRGFTPAASARLAGVSCASPSGCMAVGGGVPVGGGVAEGGVAEWWNGRTLRVLKPAGPAGVTLNAVSCASASRCMAVGFRFTGGYGRLAAFAGQWNGRRWRVLKPRDPSKTDILTGVSCVSASDCVAVGSDRGHLFRAEHWNGRIWRLLKIRTPASTKGGSTLSGISCASASRCLAVGFYYNRPFVQFPVPVAESWNGKSWRLLSAPDPGGGNSLSGVSCSRPSRCMAVGSGPGGPLAEAWNGSTWKVISPAGPAGGQLDSVSCLRPALCMATGAAGAGPSLAEEWNGTTWQVLATPSPGDGAFLLGVSCTRGQRCLAVGVYGQEIGGGLAERWDGTTWRLLRTGKLDDLSGVSCPRASRCIAVGSYLNGSDVADTLALARNGTAWHKLTTPSPGPHVSELRAVSCASPSSCMAIGFYDADGNGANPSVRFAETWNGTTWTRVTSGSLDFLPAGLACPAPAACITVSTGVVGGNVVAIAQAWDGTTWHALSPAVPGGAELSELNGISCTSPANCIAVGDYQTDPQSDDFLTLAERWDGSTWQILPTSESGGFTAVSCTRPSSCVAVGPGPDGGMPLVAEWNGTTWRQLATPVPGYLASVSCAGSSACMAVGSGPAGALAESWNGSKWRVLKIPASSPGLSSVSCTSASNCLAVGQTDSGRALAETWNGTRWRTLTTPNP